MTEANFTKTERIVWKARELVASRIPFPRRVYKATTSDLLEIMADAWDEGEGVGWDNATSELGTEGVGNPYRVETVELLEVDVPVKRP